MPKSKLSEIIRRLMFNKCIRAMELARATHLPQPTVQRIVTGTTANPHLSSLLAIANYFGVSIEQLKGNEPIPNFEIPKAIPEGAQQINILDWSEAGIANPSEPTPLGRLFVEDTINPHAFALILPDDAMYPLFGKGSFIIIDSDKVAKDRSYVLAKLKNHPEPIFRQLLLDANRQFLKSLNPEYANFPILELQKEDKIIGVLVQARKNFEE